MNIDEARKAKTDLENEIRKLLREFTEKTSLTVTSIGIKQWYNITQFPPADYSVFVKAQLESTQDQDAAVLAYHELRKNGGA